MDKRRHKRWPQQFEALIMQNGRIIEGTTSDISHSGLSLVIREMTVIGNDIPISISLPSGRQEITAELSWSQKEKDGRYRIGVRLISATDDFINFAAMLRYQ